MMTYSIERYHEVAGHFAPARIGAEIRSYERVDSTNRLALDLPAEELRHGMVLVADEQTAGRGRQGRSWISRPDLGLYFTVLLLPPLRGAEIVPLLGLAAALAVYDSLRTFCHGKRDIKWPNDVLLEGRKISGILGEMSTTATGLSPVALGIAINVSHTPHDFPEEIRDRAASIRMFEGAAPSFNDLLLSVLSELNSWYDRLLADPACVAEGVASRSTWVSGRRLRVETMPNESVTGTSNGINPDGSLQLRLDSGLEIALRAGDMHLLGT